MILESRSWRDVIDATLWGQVCHWLATGTITHWTQLRHITLKIQVLAWDTHIYAVCWFLIIPSWLLDLQW